MTAEESVVFRTSQPDEAPLIAGKLFDAGIPFEVRIVVQAEREAEAIGLIEAHMAAIGSEPTPPISEPNEDTSADAVFCPNCEKTGLDPRRPCAGCGFTAKPLSGSLKYPAGAKSFCPECRDPLTFASGNCPRCKEELEPLEGGDRLCPAGTHVLFRDTKGGVACPACKTVWVEVG